ncbi:MAG: 6,7-dimethyl-8-ribityllumazine synthase [Saprospiraceae bacterium]|nr:6,7-dimethyl-8-ribityllumazine synthase [Bacteroidia bacterium]NNE13904.1 6,7-dimethyl-8-ribityllumazine synthase [Saprospiraceae bacterium]NNL90804.1 6,7-dimethyl-8-ribityllumazine synthase [Saprospiraceae bacterium]
MSSKDQNLSEFNLEDCPSAKDFKIHIAVSDWNTEITTNLLNGAKDTLIKLGVKAEDIEVVHVPGTFELPFAAKCLMKSHTTDAVICLGCVIRGETKHDDYINNAVANGITHLSLVSDKPVIYGVVTTNDKQQAIDRSGGIHGNKGIESAVTAVKMVALAKNMKSPKKSIGF